MTNEDRKEIDRLKAKLDQEEWESGNPLIWHAFLEWTRENNPDAPPPLTREEMLRLLTSQCQPKPKKLDEWEKPGDWWKK
jgi:hypothetical protein